MLIEAAQPKPEKEKEKKPLVVGEYISNLTLAAVICRWVVPMRKTRMGETREDPSGRTFYLIAVIVDWRKEQA